VLLLEVVKDNFDHVVVFDTEYRKTAGENPIVVCMVLKDIITGRCHRLKGKELKFFPFPIDDNTLFVAHYAVADIGAMLALGFKKPKFIFDTLVEDKKLRWGKVDGQRFSLLESCRHYGVRGTMSEEYKESMRKLIMEHEKYTAQQMKEILEYCEEDILNAEKLFYKLLEEHDREGSDPEKIITQAAFHGRAAGVCAQAESNGIPIRTKALNDFNAHFEDIKKDIITKNNKIINVYDENNKFKYNKFSDLIYRLGLQDEWELSEKTHKFRTDKHTLRKHKKYKEIQLLRETKEFADSRNLKGFQVGSDGRSRTDLKMYGQITGRTNVSPAESPFGAPKWVRNYIGPDPKKVLCYGDWVSQEAGIMAYLSGDKNMVADFETGNIYLICAIKNNAAPAGAVKATHPEVRGRYKVALLGCGYGQTAFGLKHQLEIPAYEAEKIIDNLKKTYPNFFTWNDGAVVMATGRGFFRTKYGWRYWTANIKKENTLKNWLMQSHGAEIMRKAMIAIDEAGIEINMPVHDAILFQVNRKGCAEKIRLVRRLMEQAAKDVLDAPIPVEFKIIRKQFDQEGKDQEKWERIMSIYNEARCNKKLHHKKEVM
jgi:hypothetical protein